MINDPGPTATLRRLSPTREHKRRKTMTPEEQNEALAAALKEAWAKADRWKQLATEAIAAVKELEAERDEARAEVERLRVLLRFVRDDAKSMEEAVAAAEDVDHD